MASNIEWTNYTPNPIVGCTKKSAGCENCYAIRMAWRLMHSDKPAIREKYAGTVYRTPGGKLNWTGKINVDYKAMAKVLTVKKPSLFFVNSMGDLFHPSVSFFDVLDVFQIMVQAHWHTFQILTKHPDRMLEFCNQLHFIPKGNLSHLNHASFSLGPLGKPSFAPNIWLGTSVENQKAADERIPLLIQIPAAIRYLSCEPLIGLVDLIPPMGYPIPGTKDYKPPIDWVICGGESGPNARPMHPDWARVLRNQCKIMEIKFFFKQWGNWANSAAGIDLEDISRHASMNVDGNIINGHEKYRRLQKGYIAIYKFNKHKNGRMLDDVLHNEYPLV